MSPRAAAFRPLDARESERLRLFLHARDAMTSAQIDLARARVRSRLAEEFRRALKRDGALRRMEADLLARRADGLRQEANALGASRWIYAQLVRAGLRFDRGR